MRQKKRLVLKSCREDIKLTRAEAALLFGISIIHLRKLEDGDVGPSAPLMMKISKYYGKTPNVLFPDVV